jgi:hypothetical protein
MKRIIAAIALTVGGLGLAACHSNDPVEVCRAWLAEGNGPAGSWSLVSARDDPGPFTSCLIRNNATFQTVRRCVSNERHEDTLESSCA